MRRPLSLWPLATCLAMVLSLHLLGCGGGGSQQAAGGAAAGGGSAQPAAGQSAPAEPADAAEPALAGDDILAGTEISEDGSTTTTIAAAFDPADFYANHCAKCHGVNGEGGKAAPAYVAKLHHTDAYLAKDILEGEGEMPAFKDKLTEEQALQMVAWIRAGFGGGMQPKEDDGHDHDHVDGDGHDHDH